MNGATEATLAELLAVAQAQNVNLVNMIKELRKQTEKLSSSGGSASSAGSAATQATSALGGLVSALNPVNIAFKALNFAANAVAAVFDGVGVVLGKVYDGLLNTAANMIEFSKAAMEGKAKLADLINVFRDLPFFLGQAAGVISSFISIFEKHLDQYRDLTKIGASFGGSLSTMVIAAAKTHLTLTQFSEVIKKNSDIFATMGGNVQSGIDRFVNAQNKLMDPGGPFAKRLLALGYTSEEAAGALASYMRGQGTLNKQELANADLVSNGVIQYAEQLDTLSKITGKRREQIQQEYDDVADEEAFQAYLATLGPEAAAATKAAVVEATQAGGKDLGKQMMLAAQGINVARTDAQKALAVSTEGRSLETTERIANAIRDGKSAQEIAQLSRKDWIAASKQQNQFYDQMGTGLRGYLSAQDAAVVRSGDTLSRYGRTIGDLEKAEKKAADDRDKQGKGNAITFAVAQQKLIEFGNQLTIVLYQALEPMMPYLLSFGEAVLGVITRFVGSGGLQQAISTFINVVSAGWEILKKVFDWATDYYNNLKLVYEEGGWELVFKRIWEDSTKALGDMWDSIWPIVKPKLEQAFEQIKPVIVEMFRGLFTAMGKALGLNVGETTAQAYTREAKENNLDRSISEKATIGEALQRLPAQIVEGVGRLLGSIPGLGFIGTLASSARSDRLKNEESYLANQNRLPKPPEPKALGNFINPGSYLVGEKGPEVINTDTSGDVITNENLTALLKNTNNNNQSAGIQQLNIQVAQLLQVMRENNDYTRRTLDATKGLGGNLYA
jgi:hypothetical protein